jgi:hypothetical protein
MTMMPPAKGSQPATDPATAQAALRAMSDADPQEFSQFLGFRWWSAEELEASKVLFFPRRLPELMRRLAREGSPSTPFDVGG